jgi:hypothetical protein
MRKLPVTKGDPTSIIKLRNPAWAEEIAAQLGKAAGTTDVS